jgi:hypothetical protein
MRINIEWVAPWMRGWDRGWVWHSWSSSKGPARGRWSGGFILLGLNVMLTRDAYWSGFSLSVNVWDGRKRGA